MTKMTYVDALNIALTADLPEEVKEKLTALRDQTAKRNSGERKPTKTQMANVTLGEKVLAVLRDAGKPVTVTELMALDEELGGLSNQKVSAILRGLGDKVVKEVLLRGGVSHSRTGLGGLLCGVAPFWRAARGRVGPIFRDRIWPTIS